MFWSLCWDVKCVDILLSTWKPTLQLINSEHDENMQHQTLKQEICTNDSETTWYLSNHGECCCIIWISFY